VILEITIIIGLVLFIFYSGYFLFMIVKSRHRGSLNNPDRRDYVPFVSVIVPTYNEEDTIVHRLRNLMEQEYVGMEIIVVDSASEDKTVDLIRKFVKDNNMNVKLISEKERKGKASALNEAFKHCCGEIVVMTDADAIWEKNALRKALSNFSDQNVGAVTGRQILINSDQSLATKVEKTYRSVFEVLRLGESVLDSTPIFHGEISCFKRKLVDHVSKDSMADDSELAVKIRKKGFKSVYDPDAVFYELAPPSFKSRFIQKVRRGQGLIQLFWRERGILFNSKYGKFGTIVFPAEFFMHIISPTLVFAFLIPFLYGLFSMGVYILIGLLGSVAISFVILTLTRIGITNFILSFFNSQFILLASLMYHVTGKSQHRWRKVDEIRELWRSEKFRFRSEKESN